MCFYTKSGPLVWGKEFSEVALLEPPKKRKLPKNPAYRGQIAFNVWGSLQTFSDFRRLHETTNSRSVHSRIDLSLV